jgi:hypothetical protein
MGRGGVARKPAYRLAAVASRILRSELCTHRRIHLQGARAWVRSAAAVAVLSASRGPGVWRCAALVLVAMHVEHLTGTAIISFRWTCPSSFGDVGSLKMPMRSAPAYFLCKWGV